MQEATRQYTEPDPQPNSNRLPPNGDTATINGSSGSHTTHRSTQQSVIQLTRQQPAQNQHPNAHTTEWHITSRTSRFNRRNNTDHEPSHQQQQERRHQQEDDEKHQDLQQQQ